MQGSRGPSRGRAAPPKTSPTCTRANDRPAARYKVKPPSEPSTSTLAGSSGECAVLRSSHGPRQLLRLRRVVTVTVTVTITVQSMTMPRAAG